MLSERGIFASLTRENPARDFQPAPFSRALPKGPQVQLCPPLLLQELSGLFESQLWTWFRVDSLPILAMAVGIVMMLSLDRFLQAHSQF